MTPADQTSPRAKSLARAYEYLLRRADQIEAQKQTTDPTRRDDNEPQSEETSGGKAAEMEQYGRTN